MIVIRNARVIDPKSKMDQVTDLVLDGGRILRIGKALDAQYEQEIDATGWIAAPGLIDVHVHFRDPGQTYKEDLVSGSAAAAAGGFTTVVCMANTKPIVDCPAVLADIRERAQMLPIHVLQTSSVTRNFEGIELVDMEAMVEAGAAGFTDDGVAIMDAALLMEALIRAKELRVPVSLHEEDPSLIEKSGVNQGRAAKQLGFGGAPAVAEDTMVARDCMLALATGAMVDIQHISSKNAVAMVRFAKKMGAHVVAEASPHHFTLTEDDVLAYGTLCKMNPPVRTEEDKNAIIEGLKDGTIEIIATDHAPHSQEEKAKSLAEAPSGIIGLETSLALGVTKLVKKGHLPMRKLLEKMTVNPAALYHLDAGYLAEGGPADLVLFDPEEVFTIRNFASKASNSPFAGARLTGKVKYTICKGKIAYRDNL